MNYIMPAAIVKLRTLAENDDEFAKVYNLIESAFAEGMDSIEIETIKLDAEVKMELLSSLEDLGYEIDETYGEDIIYVSVP
jgi:hypothetical protein